MIVYNVEQLINALETFDEDQELAIGEVRGKCCLLVGLERIPIIIPSGLM